MQRLKYILKELTVITKSSVAAIEIKVDRLSYDQSLTGSKTNLEKRRKPFDNSILALVYNISSVIDVHGGDMFKIIMLGNYVEIIIDEDKLADVTKLIPKGYMQALRPGLCEITFLLNKTIDPTISETIYSEFIDNDIDVVQTISNSAGYTILVDKNDFVKVSKLINTLSEA